jgi:hypothetical protein
MFRNTKVQTLVMMISCLCVFESLAMAFSDAFKIQFQPLTITATTISIGFTAVIELYTRFRR